MYTSTYTSSPARTPPAETTSSNYQTPSHLREQPPSSTAMNDNNFSTRRAAGGYGNSSSITSIPLHNPTSPRRHADDYRQPSSSPTRYQSSAYPSTYRSNTNDTEPFRSNTARYDLSGNVRAYSYDNLFNESARPQSSMHHSRENLHYASQQQQQQQPPRRGQYTDYDDDDDDLVVKSTDLPASYEQEMLSMVRAAFRKYQITNQRELAGFLKRAADKTFTPCWHCIVGRQFSSYVTHEMNGFIYFTKGALSILLFKSGA